MVTGEVVDAVHSRSTRGWRLSRTRHTVTDMTSDPGLSRRVARVENDTESIYELFTEVRSTQDEHTRRFDQIESTLNEVVRCLPEPS
jgi:hypothetical protein